MHAMDNIYNAARKKKHLQNGNTSSGFVMPGYMHKYKITDTTYGQIKSI